jgi:hypothetical protein
MSEQNSTPSVLPPLRVIEAFTHIFETVDRDHPVWVANTTVFGTKFTRGGDTCGGPCGLVQALLEPWDHDVHYAQYHNPEGYRCTKDGARPPGLRFDFLALDLDWEQHGSRPTLQDYAGLVETMFIHDYTPNIIYNTLKGARLIYLIEPLIDPDVFERHYRAFTITVSRPLRKRWESTGQQGYQVDMQVRDWTRLFRAPSVVRDNDGPYRDSVVRVYDLDRLDLLRFKAKAKTTRAAPTASTTKISQVNRDDLTLILHCRDIVEGQRNSTVFKAACYTLRKYQGEAAEAWLERIRAEAIKAGLPEREIDQTIASARKRT